MRALASVTKESGFVTENFSPTKRHPKPATAAKAMRKNPIFMRVICFLQLFQLLRKGRFGGTNSLTVRGLDLGIP
jgi:hypothetical protein